ncbi:hypothetical protein CU048_04530 [Beijerinckiaceae bacterium]|nr:hypothetical protein CU048_04530 [Beijerinckiaceae bacterium]
MAVSPREAAIEALIHLVGNAYAWKLGPARRLRLWSDVPAASRPACFVYEGGQETYGWSESANPKRTLEVRLFIYLNAKDPSVAGAVLVNNVLDRIDAAFSLSGSDIVLGRNTLNGSVYHCRIDGRPLKDPGDLDGDALVIVPVKLVLP